MTLVTNMVLAAFMTSPTSFFSEILIAVCAFLSGIPAALRPVFSEVWG